MISNDRIAKIFRRAALDREAVKNALDKRPAQTAKSGKGRKPSVIDNRAVRTFLQDFSHLYSARGSVDDMFTGVARLELHNNTYDLNKNTLFAIMAECDSIDSDLIQYLCEVKERQAQYCLRACKILNTLITNYYKLSD